MKKIIDVLTIGFALFAMLFGAGNLIFPPYLGWQCGSNWFWSFLCFILVDVGLSIAAIFVIAGNNKGGEGVLSKLGIRTGKILLFLITVFLGPLLAVPRTAATTFEMGVLPLIPEANSWVFAFAFFTLVILLCLWQKKVVDIGRWFCLCRHGTPDKAFSRFPGIGRMVCSCEGAQLRGHTLM